MLSLNNTLTVEQVEKIEGHFNVIEFENNRIACLNRFCYTVAILADFDEIGYANRWCYHSLLEAKSALQDWNGVGEPQGWIKHLPSLRRRDRNGIEYKYHYE